MENKLVTLAIRTYQQAQVLKTHLERNGIETVIHNLNLENPEVAVGVRVRIKESDLPQALKIVEEQENEWDFNIQDQKPQILIPVDLADLVENTINFGFHFAKTMNAEVVLLYVYYMPTFTILEHKSVSRYSIGHSELLRRTTQLAKADAENLKNLIKKRIESNQLPDINFRFEIKEGIAEEQIIDYCKKNNPALVVMGTRGKSISPELVGSVTAEVMENISQPVFSVPIESTEKSPHKLKRVAFLTNFDQKDLIAIDKLLEICKSDTIELYFIHASEKKEVWGEILLSGIKTYFSDHYPHIKTNYDMISSTEKNDRISDYLQEKEIDLLAFNSRKRNMFRRLFNPGLAYHLVLNSDTMLFVTHV
jgi:Universal stress protein UspA and related nucleotide-binding proteins